MNKKKNSSNLQSTNRNTGLKKRNNDTNHTLTEDSLDDSKISDKSQSKKSIKNNNSTSTSLNINAPPYKSYRKHIDRKKNQNNLIKNMKSNDKINTSYNNKSSNNIKKNENPKNKKVLWNQNITSSSSIIKNLFDKYNTDLLKSFFINQNETI